MHSTSWVEMVKGLPFLKPCVNSLFYKMNKLYDTVIQKKNLKCLVSKEIYESKFLSSLLHYR